MPVQILVSIGKLLLLFMFPKILGWLFGFVRRELVGLWTAHVTIRRQEHARAVQDGSVPTQATPGGSAQRSTGADPIL